MLLHFIATLALYSTLSFSSAASADLCKIGNKVEAYNITWYSATVVEIGTGDRAGFCKLKKSDYPYPSWINSNDLRIPKTAANTPAASAAPPIAKYSCGVFLSGNYTFTQSVILNKDGTYKPSVGAAGRYKYDAATKKIEFDGGNLKDLFGRYEAENHQIFRLTSKADAAKSVHDQDWRSQICSPQK